MARPWPLALLATNRRRLGLDAAAVAIIAVADMLPMHVNVVPL